MPETIKSLKRQLKWAQLQLSEADRQSRSRDDDQRNTIKHEREINARLTIERFELERKIRRCEDQHRAVLLVLENPAEQAPPVNTVAVRRL